jgi:hypothetical protein
VPQRGHAVEIVTSNTTMMLLAYADVTPRMYTGAASS